MTNTRLPKAQAPIAGSFPPAPDWFNFLRELANQASASSEEIATLLTEIEGLDLGTLQALAQAQGVGFAVKIPGSWVFRHINGSVDRVVVTTGDGVSSNPQIDLATIVDTGVGAALWKFTRDAWGRVEGTESATTDDLAEGVSNFYFTVERAQDAVGSILVDTANITLTYDDTGPSVAADLTDTGVTPDTYGSATSVAQVTVDEKGRITGATNVPIDFPAFAPITEFGTGTPYILTATPAAVDMGTTDPAITIDEPGTYLLRGFVQLDQAAGTVVAETVDVTYRRTNNTPADLADGALTFAPLPTTAVTYTAGVLCLPEVVYTTANSDDAITIFISLSAALGAGDLQVSSAQIIAHRIT